MLEHCMNHFSCFSTHSINFNHRKYIYMYITQELLTLKSLKLIMQENFGLLFLNAQDKKKIVILPFNSLSQVVNETTLKSTKSQHKSLSHSFPKKFSFQVPSYLFIHFLFFQDGFYVVYSSSNSHKLLTFHLLFGWIGLGQLIWAPTQLQPIGKQ